MRQPCRSDPCHFANDFRVFQICAYGTVADPPVLSHTIRAVTNDRIAAFRLARHHLSAVARLRRAATVESLCSAVSGVQAQVMSAAELSLWARNHAVRRADIADALWTRRSLVKTSAMRQTLHLIPAGDFWLYITALRESRMAAFTRLRARLTVTAREAQVAEKKILDALADGPLTQQALIVRAAAGASAGMRRWLTFATSALRPLIVQGLVCYGQPRGAHTILVRTDQWLPTSPSMSEDDAKRELLRRFLGVYGPATVRDFVKWSGITMREARPVWEAVAPEMLEIGLDGAPAWILRRDARALASAPARDDTVRLLPAFDCYLLAHAAKDHLLDAQFYKRVYRNQGWLSPVVLHGGRIVAIWVNRGSAAARFSSR